MQAQHALEEIRVVDLAGTVSTSYCTKLCADYGADVINLEPTEGFSTRRLAPFIPSAEGLSADDASAMHGYLSTNKKSVVQSRLSEADVRKLVGQADLLLDDGSVSDRVVSDCTGVRSTISWYGKDGPYAEMVGSDGQIFALNGMLRGIGRIEGPPLIPTGYQAQIVAGMTAFIGGLTQVLAAEIGNRSEPVHLETSIFESNLCFTDVGVISAYNTGLEAPRMGINRYPPTYPLGIFACRDGWLGVTVLTPNQWQSFCELLDMPEFADVELFQTSVGRLQARDVIEPVMCARLASQSAEELFYRGQNARIPLARVPTMEELFAVDQFVERNAFTTAILPNGSELSVPSVPFRLFRTPPNFGGPVASLGEHTQEFDL